MNRTREAFIRQSITNKWLTVKQIAKKADCSETSVRTHIRTSGKQKYDTKKEGRTTYFKQKNKY